MTLSLPQTSRNVQPAKASVSPSLYAAGDVSQSEGERMLSQAKKCENQQNEQKIKLNSLIPVTQTFAKIHDFDGHVIGEVALNFKFTKHIT